MALETLLKAYMHPSAGSQDDLFDQDRPLGSLSAKIAICRRLGLIDQDVEHALHMIRRIRNDFAHSFGDETLSHEKQQQRLAEATAVFRKSAGWAKLGQSIVGADKSAPVAEFARLLIVAVSRIEIHARLQSRSAPRTTITAV
ncbi:MAG: DUF4145 domain-containing protein [Vicinamibacterales bacterium]